MPTDNVIATYRVESFFDLEKAAEILAGEQSTGTFVQVPGEDALRQRFRARVIDVGMDAVLDRPSLPGAIRPESLKNENTVNSGTIKIEFPVHNFGPSLPNVLAAVAGNLFELRELAGIKLLDLDMPDVFSTKYPGPQFGVSGTRQLMGAPKELLIGTIIKPSIGMRPDDMRPMLRELIDAGIDFIKDDELIASPPYSPLAERVRVVMDEVKRGADRTGKMVMYAFNITDDIDNLITNHDIVLNAGGTCVMACVNMVGFAGVSYLRERAQLPIHGHRAMIGALMRHPSLGIGFRAYQKLARLAGVDHLHTNGLNNKFYEANDDVIDSIRAVQQPLFGGYATLPVLSSGQWAGSIPLAYNTLQTSDLLVLAGGGIHAHPNGRAAGVESMRLAWQAATKGISVETYSAAHPNLKLAIEKFGATLT